MADADDRQGAGYSRQTWPAAVAGRPKLSLETRRSALRELVRNNDDAWIMAFASTGLTTSVPHELSELARGRVVEDAATALELVVPADQSLVIEAWRRMMAEGGANTTVHPVGDPNLLVGLHFLDLVDIYDTYVGVLIGLGTDHESPVAQPSALVPRSSVMRKDQLSVITQVDDAITAILGWTTDELIGRRTLDLVHPDDQEKAVANFMALLGRPGSASRIRLRHLHKNGSWLWLEITNHNYLTDPDDPHILADVVDVDDEVRALQALRVNEQKLRRLTDALPVGVLYLNAGKGIDFRNERIDTIAGVTEASTVDEQFSNVAPDSRDAFTAALDATFGLGHDQDVELAFHLPTGKTRRCVLSLRALTDNAAEVTGAVACLVDVTDDVALREELEQRARYDQLTGCLTHVSVLAELQGWLDHPTPNAFTVAVFVDLDDFKDTNDRYGHVVGDRILKHVSTRLRQASGDGGLVGRLGGDEFLVVVRAADNTLAITNVAEQVAAALDSPVLIEAHWLTQGASIGLAYASGTDAVDAEALVAAADDAMYRSKQRDGGPAIHTDDHQ